MVGVSPLVLAGLMLAALLAGWVDAVSGGGGLVQLPALLVGLPGVPPATVLGTNKLSSIIGTSAAARTYWRAAVTDVATAVPMATQATPSAVIFSTNPAKCCAGQRLYGCCGAQPGTIRT